MSEAFDRLLTFATTFRVIAAEQELRKAGLRCGLAPTPSGVHSACGLSLRLPAASFAQAESVVEAAGLPVEGRWALRAGGWAPFSPGSEGSA